MMPRKVVILFLIVLEFCCGFFVSTKSTFLTRKPCRVQLEETYRQEEYRKRNYTWPVQTYVPDTPGWRRIFERRFAQIQQIPDLTDRYNGWLSAVTSAYVIPNFTVSGFQLTKAPVELLQELQISLYAGLNDTNTPTERPIEIIKSGPNSKEGFLPPLFIKQEELNAKVLRELRDIHSQWANVSQLIDAKTYGLRVYRNQSSLVMHTDKINTHVIASILHIDHSPDSEPWPLVLEDFHGNTHEIVMEAGDLLLYESAKVYHGRPKTFHGSWYCSIFTHYYPEGWDDKNQQLESHFGVPPIWFETVALDDSLEALEMVGTGIREPDSRYCWSALSNNETLSV